MPTEDYLVPEPPGPIERRLAALAKEVEDARTALAEAISQARLINETQRKQLTAKYDTARGIAVANGQEVKQLRAELTRARRSEVKFRRAIATAVADDQPVEMVTSRLILERIQDLKDQARTAREEYLKADGAAYEKRWAELQVLSNQALQVTRMQARIGAWGDSCPAVQKENAKIGRIEHPAIHAALDKLVEEVDELRGEMIQWEDFNRELADCAIVIFRIAHLKGFDLLKAIEAKMLEVVAKHGGVWVDREGKEHSK